MDEPQLPIEFPRERMVRPQSWSTGELLQRLGMTGPAGAVGDVGNIAIERGSTSLLTGGTGWLGRHLGRHILRDDPHARLLLPVRARDLAQAQQRILQALCPSRDLLEESSDGHWWDRIQALPVTSLAQEGLGGLPDSPEPIGHVIHCAANMSLALNIDQAWSDNVLATQRMWQWALANGAKRFDHVSTLSVFVAGDTPLGEIKETDPLDLAGTLWGGYAASKWAAEAWLAAQSESMALAVHRLGLLSYSQSDGWATNDGLAAAGRAWKQWGRPSWAWDSGRDWVDWSPADKVASGIVAAARQGLTGPLHWASRRAIPGRAVIEILEQLQGAQIHDWPKLDPVGKTARRALGRWSDRKRSSLLWWHDIFQSDRHQFNADRANTVLPRWDWSPQELKAAFARL